MGWIYLTLTILLEVTGTISMKFAEGFTKLYPSILVFICYSLSITGLTLTIKHMPISVAYSIWAGIGTALIAIIGIMWFKEPISALKLVSIGLIIIGVVGLNLK